MNNYFGLALSGGGFRAAAYHIGTFRALRKLGLLNHLNVISSNSGGSITAACYGLYGHDYEKFEKVVLEGIRKNIVIRISLLNLRFWIGISFILLPLFNVFFPLFPIVLPFSINIMIFLLFLFFFLRNQFWFLPVSALIERKYDKFFFNNATLKNLRRDIRIVINSTNLDTARVFTFENHRMIDSKYEYDFGFEDVFISEDFPLAKAVMASTCVPFAFTPITIDKKYYRDPEIYNLIEPLLVDGGVYDNQGIHKLTQASSSCSCENVLVSDAGTGFPILGRLPNTLSLLMRTSTIFMERIKNLQMINSIYSSNEKGAVVAYQSLSFGAENSIDEFIKMLENGHISSKVITAHGINSADIKNKNWKRVRQYLSDHIELENLMDRMYDLPEIGEMRKVTTSLSPLKGKYVEGLIGYAELMTMINMKIFMPHLL
jgi:NTE family protein